MLVLGAVAIGRASKSEAVPPRESLATFPMDIAEWRGQPAERFDQQILAVLGVDEYVSRVYTAPTNVSVGLYIGYYKSQREGDTMHSPLNCLPGAGWQPVKQERVTIPVATSLDEATGQPSGRREIRRQPVRHPAWAGRTGGPVPGTRATAASSPARTGEDLYCARRNPHESDRRRHGPRRLPRVEQRRGRRGPGGAGRHGVCEGDVPDAGAISAEVTGDVRIRESGFGSQQIAAITAAGPAERPKSRGRQPVRITSPCSSVESRVVPVAAASLGGCGKSAQQYFDSGNKYFAQGKFNEAAVEYKNAVAEGSRSWADAHFKLAEAYVRLGEPARAFKEYIYAADLLPTNIDAQLKAGTFLLLARRFEDARARADKVLKLDPKNLEAELLRGNATFGLNDIDAAIGQVEEAIQLDPKSGRSYAVLGNMKAAKGDTAAAEKAFRQAVEFDPKSVVAHLALGQFLAGNGRPAEAESAFKDAYTLDPKNALAARALATFYMASNRAPEAEPYLKSLAENSKDPAPTLALADYYVAMRRPDEAIALLTKAAAKQGRLRRRHAPAGGYRIRPGQDRRGAQDRGRPAGPRREEPAGAAREGPVPRAGEEAGRGPRAGQGCGSGRSPLGARAVPARHPVCGEEAA